MLDVAFLAMFLVLPVLAVSIVVVRRGYYVLHRRIQLVLGAVLLLTILAFELDLRFFTDWRKLAEPSPYYGPGLQNPVGISLIVHLLFALPASILWPVVIVRAVKKFGRVPVPGAHSLSHRFWGWVATVYMVLTTLTGWMFYLLAFVA